MRPAECRILVLADDLTGALEAGAPFASRGIEASVIIASHPLAVSWNPSVVVQVVDTETRHLAPKDAFRIVSAFAVEARGRGFRYIYKKTDSTLRGNIGSELAAVMAACPDEPLLYVPAYPQMGRTVSGGGLFVDGIPVARTGFSADLLNPVSESHIPTLLGNYRPRPEVVSVSVGDLSAAWKSAIYVVDGVSEEDVRAAAQVIAAAPQLRLLAGPAGLARHLADLMDLPRLIPPELPRIPGCLVVNGSRQQASAAQIHHAAAQGWPEYADGDSVPVAIRDWILLSDRGCSARNGMSRGALLAQRVRSVLMRVGCDGMAVFGGDTAFDIMCALGVTLMRSIGEVFPGVPVSKIEAATLASDNMYRGREFYLVAKAGGFGSADLLTRMRSRLSGS